MKELILISCQPDDLIFSWQIQIQLHNFRKFGYSGKAQVLVFLPFSRKEKGYNPIWKEIEAQFPETSFFYYIEEEQSVSIAIKGFGYSPLNRPWMLRKHFEAYPELKDKAIFYHDSDVVFTKKLDFTPFLQDDINYLSNTENYIGAAYFDSKEKDVDPIRLEAYRKIDVLDKSLKMFGLSRKVAVNNQKNSGGAQYLLKNIDSKFWADVYDGCMMLRLSLMNINQRFFPGNNAQEKEDRGFQSWCADMWSVLWNIWKRGAETRCPEELRFAWRDGDASLWEKYYIYHDAGADKLEDKDSEGNVKKVHIFFNKRSPEYVAGIRTPFEDTFEQVSPHYCSYFYVKEIEETKKFLNTLKK